MHGFHFMIYDDNKEDSRTLQSLLQEAAQGWDITIHTASTSIEAQKLLEKNISVVFLDIELETEKNGIAFASYLRQNYPHIKIVFITAHIRYSEEICPARPDGFLVKPFDPEKTRRVWARSSSVLPCSCCLTGWQFHGGLFWLFR